MGCRRTIRRDVAPPLSVGGRTTTPLKLVTGFGDNTTTTYVDALPRCVLTGGQSPRVIRRAADAGGRVLPGAAALPGRGTGWALARRRLGHRRQRPAGDPLYRDHRESTNGDPATGNGAIVAASELQQRSRARRCCSANTAREYRLAAALIKARPSTSGCRRTARAHKPRSPRASAVRDRRTSDQG